MKSLLFVTLLALVAVALGRVTIYNRQSVPENWEIASIPSDDASFTFTLALYQRNLDVLDAKFWAVSTPRSSEYQNFMEIDDILDIIAPPQEVHDAIVNFVRSFGISDIVSRRDSLVITTTVGIAEEFFSTKLFTMVHESGSTIVRHMGPYSLPPQLLEYVEMVTGVSDFPVLKRNLHARSPLQADAVVPQTLQEVYNIPSSAKTSTSQGVAEFGAGQYYSASDLKKFSKKVDIPINPLSSSHIVGGKSSAGVEGTLDIQYIATTGVGGTNWYWTEANWLYDFANSFFSASDVPLVVSISYGWSEVEQCDLTSTCGQLGIDSKTYVSRTNTEFQKIGTRGVSLLVASGDSGANGRSDPACTDTKLHPPYPAASPYVTTVGATQLENSESNLSNPPPVCDQYECASSGDEVAVSYDFAGFTSGGGFSVYADRPAYQDNAVQAYLSSAELPPSGYFNSNGRGFPDVASLGSQILIEYDGDITSVGGTSASSPSFAGYLSLLNSVSVSKTGKGLGFANPFLYQMAAEHPSAFNDITSGDNKCTEDGCETRCKGYVATSGWDPVTGLGSPNVEEMLNYLNSQLDLDM